MDDKEYTNDFKYRAIKTILKKILHVKTPEAIRWRRSARRYLENFPLQYHYRNLPTWKIDDEVFDQLQREASSLMLDF